MAADLDLQILESTQLYRPGTVSPDFSYCSNRWAVPIDRLLAARYSFLPCSYSNHGYLFRGMRAGLTHSIASGSYGHFRGDEEVCSVEQAMNVFFLTNEISDALTVSRLYDDCVDGGIIALRSTVFNEHLRRYEAAVLGIGDAGIVFRYPFTTHAISESEVAFVFVSAGCLDDSTLDAYAVDKLVKVSGRSRPEVESDLHEKAQKLGIFAASPVQSGVFPTRF